MSICSSNRGAGAGCGVGGTIVVAEYLTVMMLDKVPSQKLLLAAEMIGDAEH